jgi:hypothetical protein|tara:strand:+ start:17650 stop:18612 length:963 start_codon:yes stop_codon:yes gene_type:complete
MAKQVIGIGTTANDGTGDSLRVSAEKSNDNFTEVYTLLGDGATLPSGIVTALTAGTNVTLSGSTGNVTINASITGGSTAEVSANTLVVTGVSTLGVITGATSLGVVDVFATTLTGNLTGNVTGNVTGNLTGDVTGDGSNLTGITTLIQAGDNVTVTTASGITTISSAGVSTAEVRSNTLVVTGITTLGIVTGVTSVEATDFYGNGSQLVDGKWTLGANGSDHYTFTGIGFTQTTDDPDLYLARGNVYEFVNNMDNHPFRIQSTQNGSTGTQYNTGVTNNDAYDGTTLRFEVPFSAPDTLYYQCTSHTGMGGTIFIYPTLR